MKVVRFVLGEKIEKSYKLSVFLIIYDIFAVYEPIFF